MIIALNNKSNLNKDEFINYLSQLNKIVTKHKIILCPTFLNIPRANIENKNYLLGAQNVSSNSSGAFTGEISAEQLKEENVKYCIVGHSERRLFQKESSEFTWYNQSCFISIVSGFKLGNNFRYSSFVCGLLLI